MPRARMSSLSESSLESNTAPTGTPAAPMASIASSLLRRLVQAVMASSRSFWLAERAGAVAKRGSSFSSGLPITSQSRSQWRFEARVV